MIVIQEDESWLVFKRPVKTITVSRPDRVKDALREIDGVLAAEELYAAGFVSYEAGSAFDLTVRQPRERAAPLLYFGIFHKPKRYKRLSDIESSEEEEYRISDWKPGIGRDEYAEGIEAVKSYLADGLSYQINFTFPLYAEFSGSPWALWKALLRRRQGAYTAYIDTGSHVICSLSPELFFRLDGRALVSKPMKGTAPRGLYRSDDEARSAALFHSEKNRAENLMIVDMIRNDMGRIAEVGSVEVPVLFEVERYPTLLQMTSTVRCRTAAPLSAVFEAMFPCASITGAPKVKSMELIAGLESAPRGVYCGSIGYAGPGRHAQFNVAIRTLVTERRAGSAVYGVGGGIVWDSVESAEYEECLLKAKILEKEKLEFQLIESLLWEPAGGYFLLDRHLHRLSESAEYFGFLMHREDLRRRLLDFGYRLSSSSKVRLLLSREGDMQLEAAALCPPDDGAEVPLRAAVCPAAVNSGDVFLYHKTTRRRVYEEAKASRGGCDDVILMNERGELTEASSSNIMVRLSGIFYTPPLYCGLLPGTYRAELLDTGILTERVLYPDDLRRAESVCLINSVRRQRPAVLVD